MFRHATAIKSLGTAAAIAALAAIAAPRTVRDRTVAIAALPSDRVCAESTDLVRHLVLSNRGFRLSALPVVVQTHGCSSDPAWIVDVSDLHGEYLAELVRDARTGELLTASRLPSETPVAPKHHMSASEAAAIGRRWLYDLRIGARPAHWSLTDAPELTGSLWRVHYGSPSHIARLSIDRHDGNLITLYASARRGRALAMAAAQ